ncbi:MAG: hypothetical protein KME04_09205 [Pleurocapsa minor GSE-CHR-MK-17-07R]|jgi:hypothetical protein|nr:hypothetical protein [Pleurocapsa minor GSE-CHR-MK 17-07R]
MDTSALLLPKRIWIEKAQESGACDVLVLMDDGAVYTAAFVTMPFLRRQMDLTFEACSTMEDTPPARFAALETPHIIVDNLSQDSIEDTIDNLLALGTFGSVFTQVSDADSDDAGARAHHHEAVTTVKRATAEVTAVVLNEVLIIDGEP